MTDDPKAKRRPRPAVEYGPIGEQVAKNVHQLRKLRGMTVIELSALLVKNGWSITPSAVTKIELRKRQVSVDDLAALAAALGVEPVDLLLHLDMAAVAYSTTLKAVNVVRDEVLEIFRDPTAQPVRARLALKQALDEVERLNLVGRRQGGAL